MKKDAASAQKAFQVFITERREMKVVIFWTINCDEYQCQSAKVLALP